VASDLAREILLAHDIVARAASLAAPRADQRWMLSQPRAVRVSYVREVLDRGGGEREQRIWMLRQSAAVRRSYLLEVASRGGGPKPEVAWMLNQPDAVRESYVRECLDADPR
jgi:hypothetical protein